MNPSRRQERSPRALWRSSPLDVELGANADAAPQYRTEPELSDHSHRKVLQTFS